jgi:hypothetical protein
VPPVIGGASAAVMTAARRLRQRSALMNGMVV